MGASGYMLMTVALIACETQDFASPEKLSAMEASGYMLMTAAFLACETQDFASLLWGDSDIIWRK